MANCCKCSPADPAQSCRINISAADLGDLIYLAGLDASLCPKYETPADLICDALAALDTGGSVVYGETLLVGSDCQTYTIPTPDVGITVTDTPCINLEVTEDTVNQFVITATLNLDNDANNVAVCNEDGLFVPSACAQFVDYTNSGPIVFGETLLVGQDCTVYTVVETPQEPLLVADSDCIDLTINGTIPQTLSADLIIDPDGDNVFECRDDGVFVPSICAQFEDLSFSGEAIPGVTRLVGEDCETYSIPLADVNIVASDSACLDLSVVEAPENTFTISGDVIISPNAGNAISCAGNGLYVAAADFDVTITGVDTDCIDMTVTEGPDNVFQISADIAISSVDGNIISCIGDGLYANADDVSVDITGIDTDCIDITVTEFPANVFGISATPIIANARDTYPAGCNGLVCQDDGLAVHPDIAGNYAEASTPGGGFYVDFISMTAGQTVSSNTAHIDIVNPSDCRSAILHIGFKIPGVTMENAVADPTGAADQEVWIQRNLPAIQVDGAPVKYTDFGYNFNGLRGGSPPAERSFTYIVPPSFTGSFETYAIFQMLTGDADIIAAGSVGCYYWLVTI